MKRYIKPETKVLKIETEQMMAASPSSQLDNTNTISNSSMFESKKHNPGTTGSLWDLDADEQEEEDNK